MDLAHLFVSTPPSLDSDEERGLVRALFYNREREFAYATEKLRAGGSAGQVLAIRGATRAGISHFARRLVLALEEQRLIRAIARSSSSTTQTSSRAVATRAPRRRRRSSTA